MKYKVLDDGQVLIEINDGVWTYYDMEYHFFVKEENGTVKVEIYNYKDEPVDIDDIEITYNVDGIKKVVKSKEGRAELYCDTYQYIFISGERIRGEELKRSDLDMIPSVSSSSLVKESETMLSTVKSLKKRKVSSFKTFWNVFKNE
ncbi:hypothetical protein [Paenibacillus aquistagni]|uniref:hypothetical protein n=1 Tax=Paenibacillus aquistagni TaxID=1852522 RepID=UPI000B4FE75A|nr:hypothetical protein [Paenibacillus aquistagni]